MLSSPIRYCGIVMSRNHGALPINKKNMVQAVTGYGRRNYAKDDKDPCCKNIPQTEGKQIENWPKDDPPPPMWRCDCPCEPQPPNYDPYRIKVPDIMVPPLPPSNAKWNGVALTTNTNPPPGHDPSSPGYGYGHPSYGGHCGKSADQAKEEENENTFLGILKGFFGKGKKTEGKGSGDTMMPMIDCAKTKGPCSVQPVPKDPPCIPPPRPPFPWIYVWAVLSFFTTMGVLYRLFLWKEKWDKIKAIPPVWRPRRKVKRPYHDKDLPACVQYLIIGTGTAGWSAYKAIMEHDKTAKVFFVTKEDCLPYKRPEMSKHMWWNEEPPDLSNLNFIEEGRRKSMYYTNCKHFMDPVKFYRKKTGPAVSIASGWCCLRIDAENHIAYIKTMCGEQPIYYERCLLAPGSTPKNLSVFKSAPKAVRDRVTTFRTIRDLETAYRRVKAAKHVVILGGGVLGCELAWHLGRMNKVVPRKEDEEPIEFVQIFKDKGILSSIIPEYLGEWAAEKIKCEGVTLIPKTQVYDAFESPDGRLELTLSNGTSLVTDYVLVAIGNQPRTEMAEPSFLETDSVNGGFLVNTELKARTHLYVAGDAASFYSQWKDARRRFEHWDMAEEQGYLAGANMTGYWLPGNFEPNYWFILGKELEMQVVGEVGGCMPTVGLFKPCAGEVDPKDKAVDPAGDKPCYKKTEEYKNRYKRGMLFYLRDETVVGMVFWNFPPIEDRKEVATELLRAEPSYKDINLLAELLGFPDLQCVYIPPEDLIVPGPCIKWQKYPKVKSEEISA